ncbi:uncharacterized protein BT62DRAFT_927638 [Guyanagaster necrorhizus]|uniref:DH domain-containing protein n=1 Tax=Guyanagaster necrorhizus TaxID=856835 RepID=A0A9P8AXV3_9AGAR|nr:uncharacterized protein BT62DRAFT_927638 [Guyanagaster necrorhizus MCA 3950]KAG7450322.1 hypothetical protein BT62DRAFT_927638 [Guyanagaster necrorhizus MCA 3950]
MLSSSLTFVDLHNPDIDADYLRAHSSITVSSPSPSPSAYLRRAPTASPLLSPIEPDWSPNFRSNISPSTNLSEPISESVVSLNSPASSNFSGQSFPQSLPEGDPSFTADSGRSRSAKSLLLPDPSQFPDSHPFRPPHHHFVSPPPGLSDSSSSTRSSGYTSTGSTLLLGDFVHVASGDDESAAGRITSDSVVQLLGSDAVLPTGSPGVHSRAPIVPVERSTRWSEGSFRSRSSSLGNNISSHNHDHFVPRLHEKPSYDMGWHTFDERDEVGMSEEDTDDDQALDDEYDDDDKEERTSAAVIADEGRGLIVHGDNVPLAQLSVQPGTTHLLVGSSANPNAMPAFLTNNIPQIYNSLLALDISANFLGALPPVLALCASLEELNIASNPLRVLPVFLADLLNLRVLIADSTGISTLPETLGDLDKLHTISVRRNKMHALPSWLCLLPALQTLCVDGNPFQGPWKALVEPLLAKTPRTPVYPLSTPVFPLSSASTQSGTETDGTDGDDFSGPPSAVSPAPFTLSLEDEEQTIIPAKAPFLAHANSVSLPTISDDSQRPLVRTRTTPNRSFYSQNRARSTGPALEESPHTEPPEQSDDAGYFGDHEIRKMKSAGDLRRGASATPSFNPELPVNTLTRPPLTHYATSVSSNNLLAKPDPSERPITKRFASLGASTALGSPPRSASHGSRPALTASLWDNISEGDDQPYDPHNRVSFVPDGTSSPKLAGDDLNSKATVRLRPPKDSKEKGSRWGFLKKMSMGKMKIDSPSRPLTAHSISGVTPRPSNGMQPLFHRTSKSPQIDVRFSTTGNLDAFTPPSISTSSPPSERPSHELPSTSQLAPPSLASSSTLLVPSSPAPRSGKRRSFLPFDTPISLTIPEPSSFIPGVTATNDDDPETRIRSPSPVIDHEKLLRREEERAREAYMRALRSVMAYLKDMNDLGTVQQPVTMNIPGSEEITLRPRRPTIVENGREVSTALSGATVVSSDSGQLRSSESIAGMRSGGAAQTLSVATTDSGSSEERVYKDDKGKRAMVIREIVATERTYVKGLQELMDIYIKPGCAPVNMLTGSSGKETVVPPSERKVVFNGVDALFSFHKESFLPSLEVAAAPLMKPKADQDADIEGQLSLNVAKAVGNIFVKHAAFMKMYSSYINNFDHSVQRVKYWTSDRNTSGSSSPGSTMSPSSSTAQLVGLGLTMSAVSSPTVVESSSGPAGLPNLSSSQRKRIRAYLKRCRMSPRHSQLNLEGYLLLPVQRIPRYRLLLEELLRSTPPSYDFMEDPLDRALSEISLLANNMNEGKRESESRRKLVQWQARIRGKFPSPLVQPHRRLIMDGPLLLTRVVRKAVVSFEAINSQGDASTVQVDCLAPELTPRPLVGILCNDLLVLCRDPSDGQDPSSSVDLWAVLRMQTLPQPASIVHGNALRLVDNKAILYFDAPSSSDALNWYRAINLHIPASKT